MKTKSIVVAICTLLAGVVSANDGKYVQTMIKTIQALYEAGEPAQIQEIVNTFERIASVEKDKWEPLYYIAYGNIMMANLRAKALVPNESELFALEGFVSMLRVTVDPQARGPVHAPVAMQHFNKAVALDPQNPRALALMAQMQFGTAKFFSSPVTEACETNARAIEAFGAATPTNPLAPAWGKRMAEALVEPCKN